MQEAISRQFVISAATIACLCVFSCAEKASGISLGNMPVNRILFFGNSITFTQGPNQYGWTGAWGAAASEASKDYVHLVTNDIAKAAGGMPQVMATYNAGFETNCLGYSLTTPLDQQYTTPFPGQLGFVPLTAQLAFHPDVVVVAIGENVPGLDTQAKQDQYLGIFENLLSLFKANGNPTIFVRSEFWADSVKDSLMRQAAEATGTSSWTRVRFAKIL